MIHEIVVSFQNAEDAAKVDLTRVGPITGRSENGLHVTVEPDIQGWDEIADSTRNELLEVGLRAAGVWVTVVKRNRE